MSHNLQGIVRKATINMQTQFDRLAYITQNIANTNTNGYKAVRFEDVIDADCSVHGTERTDTKIGQFMQTHNPLDIALQGAGYIPVTTLEGEIRYTRDGSFTVNKDGMLVTKTGELVGSGIFIDSTAEKTEIRPNGDVYIYKRAFDEPEYSGTIPVVQFNNPEALEDVGSSEFIANENTGAPRLIEDHEYIKQYGIEHSNVNLFNEIYSTARMNASFIASSSLMKTIKTMHDTMMQNLSS